MGWLMAALVMPCDIVTVPGNRCQVSERQDYWKRAGLTMGPRQVSSGGCVEPVGALQSAGVESRPLPQRLGGEGQQRCRVTQAEGTGR